MSRESFEQAVAANPDDDVVRLVYADWLDETGNEDDAARAALIRAQCEAEHAPRTRAAELNRTAKAILKAHPDWTKSITKSGFGRNPVFRRGFPYRLTIAATKYVLNADKLFELHPTVRAIHFWQASNEVELLAGSPDLARLDEVNLYDLCQCGMCPIENDIAALIASRFVGHMARLNISRNRMGEGQAQALATSADFGSLRELDLSNNAIGDAGATAIVDSPWMGQLTRLKLRGNGIGVDMIAALRKKFGKVVSL